MCTSNSNCGSCSQCQKVIRLAGIKGGDGTNGYTPAKGTDYFDGIDGKHGRSNAVFVIENADPLPTNDDVVTNYSNIPGFGINPALDNALDLKSGDMCIRKPA